MSWTFGTETNDFDVPDYAEPLVGYRMWKIGVGDQLLSPAQNALWTPGVPLKAECRFSFGWPMNWWAGPMPGSNVSPLDQAKRKCDQVPCGEEFARWHGGYGCGIYSWSDFDYFLEHGYTAAALLGAKKSDVAIGTCYVWGRVVQQTMGYRSEFAALRSLYATHGRAGRIAAKFGVELESVPRGLTYRGRRGR